jgi:transposase InsO family protein
VAKRTFSSEQREQYLRELGESGLTLKEFSQKVGIHTSILSRWQRGVGGKKSKRKGAIHRGPHNPEARIRAVEAFLQSGVSQADFCRTWGISPKTFWCWLKAYEKGGTKRLVGADIKDNPKKRGRKGLPNILKDQIAQAKLDNPEDGMAKIRNFLGRFKGIKVSKGAVRKTLKERNLASVKVAKKRRRAPPRPRRFERARPMQLWQSDITSFLLPRNSQRCYLVIFMDDHSRYIVSWSLELRQTTDFVMGALLSGIERFGKPEEVLTDQGRQYFSWRGKTEFQKLLKKQGIRHVVARSHHPETLGKCERFWETAQNELWERIIPTSLKEAQARIGHFINHYNHFRTHQSLDGMVPADRFFGLDAEFR